VLLSHELVQFLERVEAVLAERSAHVYLLTVRVDQLEFIFFEQRILLRSEAFHGERSVLEERVQGDLERVVDNMADNCVMVLVVESNVWVIIHFEQPKSEVFVDHEVVSKELEAMPSLLLVKISLPRQNGVNHYISHLRKKMVFNRHFQVWELLIEVLLELVKQDGVALLMLAIRLLVLAL